MYGKDGTFPSFPPHNCYHAFNTFLSRLGLGTNPELSAHLHMPRDGSQTPSASRAPELCPKAAVATPDSQTDSNTPDVRSPTPTPLRLPDPSASLPLLFPALAQSTLEPTQADQPPPRLLWQDLEITRWLAVLGGQPDSLDLGHRGFRRSLSVTEHREEVPRLKVGVSGSGLGGRRPQGCSSGRESSPLDSPAPRAPSLISSPAQRARREPRMHASTGAGQVAGGFRMGCLGRCRGAEVPAPPLISDLATVPRRGEDVGGAGESTTSLGPQGSWSQRRVFTCAEFVGEGLSWHK